MSTTLRHSETASISTLRHKIGWLCELIRWLMIGYTFWILYLVLEPVAVTGAALTAVTWANYWAIPESSISVREVYFNRAFALLSWASLVVLCYAVWKLMGAYLSGEIFSAAAANCLRLVGVTGLASALVDIAIRPFMLGVMSTEILKQARFLDWVGPVDLMYILIALFVLALGHIQLTAVAISDEHKQFV
jgi:Protein of unknown function (DUF2975)